MTIIVGTRKSSCTQLSWSHQCGLWGNFRHVSQVSFTVIYRLITDYLIHLQVSVGMYEKNQTPEGFWQTQESWNHGSKPQWRHHQICNWEHEEIGHCSWGQGRYILLHPAVNCDKIDVSINNLYFRLFVLVSCWECVTNCPFLWVST